MLCECAGIRKEILQLPPVRYGRRYCTEIYCTEIYCTEIRKEILH
jgi:hypothetical protein